MNAGCMIPPLLDMKIKFSSLNAYSRAMRILWIEYYIRTPQIKANITKMPIFQQLALESMAWNQSFNFSASA